MEKDLGYLLHLVGRMVGYWAVVFRSFSHFEWGTLTESLDSTRKLFARSSLELRKL
jgi:hypothetical protein